MTKLIRKAIVLMRHGDRAPMTNFFTGESVLESTDQTFWLSRSYKAPNETLDSSFARLTNMGYKNSSKSFSTLKEKLDKLGFVNPDSVSATTTTRTSDTLQSILDVHYPDFTGKTDFSLGNYLLKQWDSNPLIKSRREHLKATSSEFLRLSSIYQELFNTFDKVLPLYINNLKPFEVIYAMDFFLCNEAHERHFLDKDFNKSFSALAHVKNRTINLNTLNFLLWFEDAQILNLTTRNFFKFLCDYNTQGLHIGIGHDISLVALLSQLRSLGILSNILQRDLKHFPLHELDNENPFAFHFASNIEYTWPEYNSALIFVVDFEGSENILTIEFNGKALLKDFPLEKLRSMCQSLY